MTVTCDVAVVGAGIVGAACAAECAAAGLKVQILDRGPIGGGTTAAGMGHIVVMDDSEAQFALTAYSRTLWHRLAERLPPDVEYVRCGTLWVAVDEDEMQEVRRKHAFYTARGIGVDVLDAAATAEAEPHLRRDLAGSLLVRDDAVIYPPAAARFLVEQAQACNAEIMAGANVRELTSGGEVVLADGTRLSAGVAVNAAGSDSPALTAGLPVRKRKGHLAITDRYPGYVRHQIVELGYLKSAHSATSDSVAFNVQPRKTGQLLIGSSRQFGADDTGVDAALLRRMLVRAAEYLPGVGNLSTLRVWTGHRAATPDKLPYIGPSVVSDRVWLATGHEGLGITTSLGTGKMLADLILRRPTGIPAAPYSPGRATGGSGHG